MRPSEDFSHRSQRAGSYLPLGFLRTRPLYRFSQAMTSAEAEATCGSRLAGMLSTNQVKLLEPEPQPVRAKTNAMVSTTAEKRIRECFKKMRSL